MRGGPGLSILLFIATTAWASAAQAALRCDLAYEVLPSRAGAGTLDLGAEALAALGPDERLAATRAEAERLPRLLALWPESAEISISAPQVTWGGWRGASSPAIHLELESSEAEGGLPAARALAALLGWSYRQDSVLLACDPAAGEESGLLAYRLQAEPGGFFSDRDRLFGFFGTTIAFAGETDLGYTRMGEAFWTIDFGGGLEPALRRAAALFEGLSDGAVTFTLEAEPVSAELPGNDWTAQPAGEGYLALLPGVDRAALQALRGEIDAALAGRAE